jgi:hypothetical protein
MQSFRGDDQAYLQWAEAHGNAYVINRVVNRPGSAMVHTAQCMHIYAPNEGYNHTANEKVCSESMDELLDWAKTNQLAVKECSTCKPYSVV